MQQLTELSTVSSETTPAWRVEPSFAARLSAFIEALRRELGEMKLELLTADLRHAAENGLAWFLTVRRSAGAVELLRAKVTDVPALDDSAREALRSRIAAHFAQ